MSSSQLLRQQADSQQKYPYKILYQLETITGSDGKNFPIETHITDKQSA